MGVIMHKNCTFSASRIRYARPFATALAIVFMVGLAGQASAQGLFGLFSSPQRDPISTQTMSFADPARPPASARPALAAPSAGRTVTYCVRLCDGRHFPIQSHNAATAAQLCNSFCPAATTKVFSGSDISRAVARDGSRYSALENAFAYRTRVVSDCTCNGRDSFGVATVDINSDPTVRAGDLVATDTGRVAVQRPN